MLYIINLPNSTGTLETAGRKIIYLGLKFFCRFAVVDVCAGNNPFAHCIRDSQLKQAATPFPPSSVLKVDDSSIERLVCPRPHGATHVRVDWEFCSTLEK